MLWLHLAGLALAAITTLDAESFAPAISGNAATVVLFMAQGCPHCSEVRPLFEALSQQFDEQVAFAEIDAFAAEELAVEHGVEGVPTFKFFTSDFTLTLDGAPTGPALERFVKSALSRGYEKVDSESEARRQCSEIQTCFLYSGDGSWLAEAMKSEARAAGSWFWVPGDADSLRVLHFGTGEESVEIGDASIPEAVDLYKFPLLPDLTRWADQLMSTPKALAVVAGPADKIADQRPMLEETARRSRRNAVLVLLESSKEPEAAREALGGHADFGIVVPAEIGRYLLPLPANADAAVDFLHKALMGQWEVSFMSEPAPIDNDGLVKRVVGANFDLCFGQEADFLLLVTSPECETCPALREALAQLAEERKGSLVVGEMNGELNEIPREHFDFFGAPALFLIRQGAELPLACRVNAPEDLAACADSDESAQSYWDLGGEFDDEFDEVGEGFDFDPFNEEMPLHDDL